jgi:hypothetical protein
VISPRAEHSHVALSTSSTAVDLTQVNSTSGWLDMSTRGLRRCHCPSVSSGFVWVNSRRGRPWDVLASILTSPCPLPRQAVDLTQANSTSGWFDMSTRGLRRLSLPLSKWWLCLGELTPVAAQDVHANTLTSPCLLAQQAVRSHTRNSTSRRVGPPMRSLRCLPLREPVGVASDSAGAAPVVRILRQTLEQGQLLWQAEKAAIRSARIQFD